MQSLLVWRAPEAEDLTWDERIQRTMGDRAARGATGIDPIRVHRCHVARLCHLGTRWAVRTTEAAAAVPQWRGLLECVRPGRAGRGEYSTAPDCI